jgi:methylmalonyl-CoA mutase N-terminal domain/subunit
MLETSGKGAGERHEAWKRAAGDPSKMRQVKFTTVSGDPIEMLYTPEDVAHLNYLSDIGYPGDYPYTRGIHPTGYRGKLWTMRQFAGFGTPEDTNERYHYLLSHGQTGLSVAFDLPTLMGRDADEPESEGEVGICGVAISSLADMEILFGGIDLASISTSMTINAPAAMLMAFYIVVAQKQKAHPAALRGTIQADILKEYIAQKEWIYPPHPSMRLITDMFEYCTKEMPQWNPISTSARPAPPPSRSSPLRSPTGSRTWKRASPRASTSTLSLPGFLIFSTRTSIFLRRSPSTAPPAGYTRGG